MSSKLGVPTEKIDALRDYANSPLFGDAEKVALEYADAMTDTSRDVDDGLFARLHGLSTVSLRYGKNTHHIVEAVFKAAARAIKDAVRVEGGGVPSTKGVI